MVIDRKYRIIAINPCSGNVHTEKDAIVFLAKDSALPYALEEYLKQCKRLHCDETHLKSMRLLIARVDEYQNNVKVEIPDTNTACEIERCIKGVIKP